MFIVTGWLDGFIFFTLSSEFGESLLLKPGGVSSFAGKVFSALVDRRR
jgi:hypothetical protein